MAPSGADGAHLRTLSDTELVALARDGQRAAVETLLHRHHDRVLAVCRRLCGNDADAADAAQEALVAVVRGLPRFDGRSSFTTWLYRIATNAALDELRRRRRRPVASLDGAPTRAAGDRTGGDPPLAVVTDHAPPLDQLVGDRLDVDAALQRLPADYRAAVVLRDLCTLDYDEIAQVLGIPPGTVRSRIARGRAALAALLGPASPPAAAPAPAPSRTTAAAAGNQPGATERPSQRAGTSAPGTTPP